MIAAAVIALLVGGGSIVFALERRRALRGIRGSAAVFRATGKLPETPHERTSRVEVTVEAVEVRARGRRPQRVEWSRLAEVAVRTTSAGPWGEDVFLLLEDDAGAGIVIPHDDAAEVLPHLQRLEGFDNSAFIRAMASTRDELVVCWRRS